VKCEPYWPALGNSFGFGSIRIFTTTENYYGDIAQRKLTLQNDEIKVNLFLKSKIKIF